MRDIACKVFGGRRKELPDGMRIRGDTEQQTVSIAKQRSLEYVSKAINLKQIVQSIMFQNMFLHMLQFVFRYLQSVMYQSLNSLVEQLLVEKTDNPDVSAAAPSVVNPPIIMFNLSKLLITEAANLAYPSAVTGPVYSDKSNDFASIFGDVRRTATTCK
ncbi:MAG: hypothetical protein EZS28_028981 [Streblomastix strix]|uniref:Uncharacterized protein n=1 Tax=Streblomastix strix TaxID=222440 RepID=A0A5J4UZ55_9EUKA|nr:MAG: hypothetical protein EZS28_028981 [Streblomastix strix]